MKPSTVLEIAHTEWLGHVEEPPGRNSDRILWRYIRDGLGWTWVHEYKNGSFKWCGGFAASCYRGLLPSVRKKHMASCYRLWKWSGGRRGNARRIAPADIRPGDIVVVGPRPSHVRRKTRPKWGRHITIAADVSMRRVCTFEGNAVGLLPDGTRGEGVVKHTRPLDASRSSTYRVLYGVRPLPEDWA